MILTHLSLFLLSPAAALHRVLSAAGLTSYAYKQVPTDDEEGVDSSGNGSSDGGVDKKPGPGGGAGVMGESDLLALAMRPPSGGGAGGRIVVVDQLPGFAGIGPHPLPPEKRKIFMYINKGEGTGGGRGGEGEGVIK